MTPLSKEEIQRAIDYMRSTNRHGAPYQWPEDHKFGRLERAVDEFMFQLEQVPPFSWIEPFLNWLSRVIGVKT
ncbi:hypothetical protein [Roseovarius sp. MMSF_3281]|uniref:hypothetical protein n=1 Tax=Roseovarius sp. MMSF_3281 TaxID=3046694 RepID=UPI00273D824F|nr:hypothetical protein [Roseovarius sp. MMSF_3281]